MNFFYPERAVAFPSRPRRSISRCSSAGLVAAVEDLVMRRAPVEVREHGLRVRRHVGHVVVLARERLDRVEGVEPHQGHELHIVVPLAPDQVDGPESRNAARLDSGDDLAPHDGLVGVGVVWSGPASPQTADHEVSLSRGSPASRTPKPGGGELGPYDGPMSSPGVVRLMRTGPWTAEGGTDDRTEDRDAGCAGCRAALRRAA